MKIPRFENNITWQKTHYQAVDIYSIFIVQKVLLFVINYSGQLFPFQMILRKAFIEILLKIFKGFRIFYLIRAVK